MTGGAHDTLRDETPRETAMFDAHEALANHALGEFSYPAVLAQFAGILDRYADAQVAAERGRIVAAIEAAIPEDHSPVKMIEVENLKLGIHHGLWRAARIARGQP